MYAIVDDKGKQYKAEVGEELLIDLMDQDEGQLVELGRVLMVGGEEMDEPRIGKPAVEGARVLAEILGEVKGPKLQFLKHKATKNRQAKMGHRQRYTRVIVREIHPE